MILKRQTKQPDLTWNEENRLRAVIDEEGEHLTRFLYDATGERVVKLGESGPSITVGQFFAVKGKKSATKHIFAGPTRLASKIVWTPEIDEDDREESPKISSIGARAGARATALVEGCSGCQLASISGDRTASRRTP